MKDKKTLGLALLVAGMIIILASLTADMIGIGSSPAFGYKQIIGVLVGIVVAVAGYMFSKK